MSIVIAVATTDKIIMKSDGREIDSQTKQIVDENSTKMKQICDNAIIGYTGDKQACDAFVETVISNIKQPICDPTFLINIINPLLQIYKLLNIKIAVVLGIIYNHQCQMFYWTSREQYKMSSIIPMRGGAQFIISGSENNNLDFKEFYKGDDYLEDSMDEYIIKISKIDSSVNSNIETKILSVN